MLNVPVQAYLIDESHFIASIRACPACSQQYLQITTETVDWQGGEDPIYRTIMPIDKAQRSRLNASTPLSKRVLESTGVGRRALKYDWPGGQAPSIYGGTGVHVGIHDYSRCNFSSERMSY